MISQVVDYIPVNSGMGGNVLQAAGAGAFDAKWRQIGETLKG